MKLKNLLFCGTLAVTLFTACEKDDETNPDSDFMVKAAQSNYAEVDAGKLASTKGTKDSIKLYGAMMVTEHTLASGELLTLANSKSVTLPTVPDQAHQTHFQMLSGMSGNMFDTAYISSQVRDHQATIALFETEASQGKDQDVKNFANAKLPGLRMHLTMAQTIRAQIVK